jgi:hypothetical protein
LIQSLAADKVSSSLTFAALRSLIGRNRKEFVEPSAASTESAKSTSDQILFKCSSERLCLLLRTTLNSSSNSHTLSFPFLDFSSAPAPPHQPLLKMSTTPSVSSPGFEKSRVAPSAPSETGTAVSGGSPKAQEEARTGGGAPSVRSTTKLALSKLIPAGVSLQLVFWFVPHFQPPRMETTADRGLSIFPSSSTSLLARSFAGSAPSGCSEPCTRPRPGRTIFTSRSLILMADLLVGLDFPPFLAFSLPVRLSHALIPPQGPRFSPLSPPSTVPILLRPITSFPPTRPL